MFAAIRVLIEAFVSIFVNMAQMINMFTKAGKNVGKVAVVASDDLVSQTKMNSEHSKIRAKMKFKKDEMKLRAKLASNGMEFKTKKELKAEKKTAKQTKFNEAVAAAAAKA